ncbi:oxidoreductase [Micrococcales bacterium 31B]|nr:oxidoreductase [Micrococcales bacterium 31B]
MSHKGERSAAWQHLADFTSSRVGVEAYIEPETHVTKPTIVLIATTGEWTRRQLVTSKEGWEWARKNSVPVYDINQTGYPQRMRDYNERQTREQQRREQREMAERLRRLRDADKRP